MNEEGEHSNGEPFVYEDLERCTSYKKEVGDQRYESLSGAELPVASGSVPIFADTPLIALAELFLRICEMTNDQKCSCLLQTLNSHIGGLNKFLKNLKTTSIRDMLCARMEKTVTHPASGMNIVNGKVELFALRTGEILFRSLRITLGGAMIVTSSDSLKDKI